MAHHHPHPSPSGNLLLVTLLNIAITVTELIGGLISNSLALLSDALHNLSDATAIIIAWLANRLARKGANSRKTFGYKRIEILAALFNASVLILITFYLFIEAWERFANPSEVKGVVMLVVATVGLIANGISVFLLKGNAGQNLNVKAAYLHLLGDTLSSMAVILGAVAIIFLKIYWIDPLLTFAIGLYILYETAGIINQTFHILMQGTPQGLDVADIRTELESIPGIDHAHHLHVWNLDDATVHLECHITLANNVTVSETNVLQEQIRIRMKTRFGIGHVIIQVEFGPCPDQDCN